MVERNIHLLVVTPSASDLDKLQLALGMGRYRYQGVDPSELLNNPELGRDCDCALIQVQSPAANEFHLISEMKQRLPALPIIAYGTDWQIQRAVQVIKVGAEEVCEFPGQASELAQLIRRVMYTQSAAQVRYSDLIPRPILQKLNSEEARILHLLVQGRTTKEVGATLDVSIRTVHYRKKELLRKLGVQNRSEAIELIRLSTGSLLSGL